MAAMTSSSSTPTPDSLGASCVACYEYLEALISAEKGNEASSLFQQAFTKYPDVARPHAAAAVALLSLKHPLTSDDSVENGTVLELIRILATQDAKFAQCLVEHVADVELLRLVLPPAKAPQLDDLPRKLRQTNTNFNFRQNKYNLMSEEPEGYSKFILALNDHDVSYALVEQLMGTFSLDPIRCLDLAVDIVTHTLPNTSNTQYETVSTLSRTTKKLPNLLAFKIGNDKLQSPEQLFQTIHWLCHRDNFDLKTVIPFSRDDSYKWIEVAEATAEQKIAAEKKRLPKSDNTRTLGTRKDRDTEPFDVSSVSSLWIVRFVLWLLKVEPESARDIVPPLSTDWSKMAILFPDSIGLALLDWLSLKIQPWLDCLATRYLP